MTAGLETRLEVEPDDLVVAAECVIRAGRCSQAMVQRKLRIGWDLAGVVVDELAAAGVVAGEVSGLDRAVLVSPANLAATLAALTEPSTRPAATPVVDLTKPALPQPGATLEKATTTTLIGRSPGTLAKTPPKPIRPRERQMLVAVRRGGAHLVTTLAKPTGPVRAGRFAARHTWMTGRGAASWTNRAFQGATHGHLREQIRIARSAGDRAALKEWVELLNDARNDRIDRLTSLPKALLGVLLAIGVAAGLALLLALLVGVVTFFATGPAGWDGWWGALGATLAFLAGLVGFLWKVATWLAWPVLGWAAWREGKRVGDPPIWLLTADQKKLADAEITPSKVVVALRDLGISELRKALKEAEDAGAGMLGPIAIAGCGVEVDVLLPSGVSTEEVQKRRRKLAENLGRHEHEVFITVVAARTVRLWIAHPGALDEPVGASPLVIDPTIKADLYTGRAPWGQNLRGEPVGISLLQRHLSIAGISNQGKTATGRALVLWLVLDVVVEVQIADLKGIGDWHMFQGIATILIEGPTDAHVIATTEMLEGGVEELARRQAALDKDRYPNGIPRELARRSGSGFHPIFYIVDEQQVAIMCPAVGPDKRPYGGTKKDSRYFNAVRYLLNQGRAYNLHVYQMTQNPTDANFPVLLREGSHIRAALPVGTESQAKMSLGETPVDKGAAPHELRAGLDKGVVVVAGDGAPLENGQHSITVRTHFIDGVAATELTKVAKERRRKAGRVGQPTEAGTVVVDHLADIHAAMRDEKRPRTVVVLGRLIEDNAAVYEPWGHDDLAKAVREYEHLGLDIRKYGGDSVLRIEEVEAALAHRD